MPNYNNPNLPCPCRECMNEIEGEWTKDPELCGSCTVEKDEDQWYKCDNGNCHNWGVRIEDFLAELVKEKDAD